MTPAWEAGNASVRSERNTGFEPATFALARRSQVRTRFVGSRDRHPASLHILQANALPRAQALPGFLDARKNLPAARWRERDLRHLLLLIPNLVRGNPERCQNLRKSCGETRPQRRGIARRNQNWQQGPRADREDDWLPIHEQDVRVPIT